MSETSDNDSNNLIESKNKNAVPILRQGLLRASTLNSLAPIIDSYQSTNKPSVLRPSSLQTATATKTDLSPRDDKPVIGNPFVTFGNTGELDEDGDGEKSTEPTDKVKDSLKGLAKNGMGVTNNLFASSKISFPVSQTADFVFGQNVHERVTGERINCAETSSSQSKVSEQSELMFSTAASKTPSGDAEQQKETSIESLTAVARAYEESRAQKRKYDEVETHTGEEEERNVLDIIGKLYAFIASNWEHLGPGNLRVNDSKDNRTCSRVVFRTSGSYRVLLNTKVWDGMVAEQAGPKSLRLTAMDQDGQVKIFLIMAHGEDIKSLFNVLKHRINLEKSQVKCKAVEKRLSNDMAVVDIDDEPSPKKAIVDVEKSDS